LKPQLGADFHPFGQTVRGIPIKEISQNWCKANEFTDELFPNELANVSPAADVAAIKKAGGSFSLAENFDGVNQLTALVGVYETCEKKVGTFLMLLNSKANGKSGIAFLKQYDKAFFAFLMPRPNNRILFADCFGCDGGLIYTWTGSELGENIALKGESVCLNRGSIIYSTANEHSEPVYKTDKLENAKVLSIGLRQGDYFWHQVKLDNGNVGFALNSTFNFEPGFCQ
jgi:hypothetical protein